MPELVITRGLPGSGKTTFAEAWVQESPATRGLPGSGKTTFAEAWVQESPATRRRVNRDSLRRMIHVNAQAATQDTENAITKMAADLVRAFLRSGLDVVVDDTNLRQRTARNWATIASITGADLLVKDFTGVPLETCLTRNDARTADARIPSSVIQTMHAKYVANGPLPHPTADAQATSEWEPYRHEDGLPWAVIVDIDGTIAKCGDRDIYDGSKAHLDTPHLDVIDIIDAYRYSRGYEAIVMTGRSEEHREVTEGWVRDYFGNVSVHMRPAGDKRRDDIVKHELFNKHIRGKYNIAAAFDDRNQVVALWRGMGIRTYQVAEGNF